VERRRWKDGTLLLEVHLTQVGRPDRSGGRAAALGRRAAPRAATLKLRAARMWPPLGLWATHGGRGGVPVWQQGGRRRIGRIGRIERFDALNALRTIAFEGSSPRVRKRAAKAYCGTERRYLLHTYSRSHTHTHTHTHTQPSLARPPHSAGSREGGRS
jgi:hypothetical protein